MPCSAAASAIAWFAMKLSTVQQAELRATTGICANEICDACRKPLDYLRYTRKDQPGEWCSRVCRDGVEAAERYKATRKHRDTGRCLHCGLQLPVDGRGDSKYCDATCKKNASQARTGK
jgi:hypothetical protein